MPKPGEHETVQARILEYAETIGWKIVSRKEAEQRRWFDPNASPKDRAKGGSIFFDALLDIKVREFNLRYAETEGALLGQFLHLHTDINGIPVQASECKNANRDEAITLGVGGSLVLRQAIADIHDGVDDKNWRQVVAKLPGTLLEQLVQEVLSPLPWGHLKKLGAAIGLPAKRPGGAKNEITPRTAQRHLGHFVDLGLLRCLGSGPATEYQVIQP